MAIAETIGSTTSSLTALQDSSLIREIDRINRKFINESNVNHPSGGWSWMEDVTNFQTKVSTSINGALTTASTTVVFTADVGFDTGGGRVWIKTSKGSVDFVDYTSFSTLTASGATDIDIAHADGEKTEKLYALPSDFAKAKRMMVDEREYFYEPAKLLPRASSTRYQPTYSLRGSYILMPEDVGQNDVTFWYIKAPTDLSTGVDATDLAKYMDIPQEFDRYAVEILKSYIYRTRRMEQKANESLSLAQLELDQALMYDSSYTTPTSLQSW